MQKYFSLYHLEIEPGRKAQSVKCLAAATCLTADPGVMSLIPAWPILSTMFDHEIISTTILLLSTDSRRAVVSYKRMYVHEVLVICSFKLARGKKWSGELTFLT